MHLDLSDTSVVVTGASRGIGHAIARHLANAGANVAAQYHRHRDPVDALCDNFPDRITAIHADLARPSECERLFQEAVERFEGIDVLVNNAGVAVHVPFEAPSSEWSEAWDLTMHVNLRAPELLCRLAVAHFRKRGGGRIINIASRAAFRGDTLDYVTYAASKGGVVALTRSIARHAGRYGVRAFVVAPGFVQTDMAQDFVDRYGDDHLVGELATDRLTEPDDVAPTVVFLASGRADHATGATIDVNAASYVH